MTIFISKWLYYFFINFKIFDWFIHKLGWFRFGRFIERYSNIDRIEDVSWGNYYKVYMKTSGMLHYLDKVKYMVSKEVIWRTK